MANSNYSCQVPFSNESAVNGDCKNCRAICSANVNACAVLEQAVKCVVDFIYPTPMEWVFICLHIVLFTIGVVGNFLVCFVVLRSKHMQTVTNLFIVNLAVADAIVLVICSPPTILQAVTESWFLGNTMCKVVIFIQNTSISVSVLTLCAIAIERYFAICRPLRSRITMRKVTITIAIIWIISAAIGSPNLSNYVVDYFSEPALNNYLKSCRPGLEIDVGVMYNWFLIIALYLVPMIVIAMFYLIISHHLWNVKIPGSVIREDNGRCQRTHAELQLASRKKVAKMLIAIVVLFAACYFPINLIFVLRLLNSLNFIDNSTVLPITFMFAYWLCYFNSSLNPLIYNFMSVKFKKEFHNVFSCRGRQGTPIHHESTGFPSSRLVRNSTHITGTRMLRTHDGVHSQLRENKHRKIEESSVVINGDSV